MLSVVFPNYENFKTRMYEHLSDFLGETEHCSGKKWSIKVEHFMGK